MRIYRIRLSDWLHLKAHGGLPIWAGVLATTPWRVINFRLAAELPRKPPSTFRCCRLIANHQSSAPSKACQKSGSFPPPALPGLIGRTTLSDSRPARRARHGVGGATSGWNGPPPITRTTFPTCRAQYPGGSETGAYVGCFPIPRGLPRFPGGSASTISLSRPAQTSLALRPAGSLNRPRRPLSRGFETAGYPTAPLVSYQINRQLSGW